MGRWVDVLAARGVGDLDEEGARKRDTFARLMTRSPSLCERAANGGEIADYARWCRNRFGEGGYLPRRTNLWERAARDLRGAVRGIEFGVALGYCTAWWLDRLSDTSTWDGFDRFTGLPRAWRELPAGAFDAGGTPPPITDPRVTWHVGNVEETIGSLQVERDGRPWLVIFDFDLYEPTLVAWERVNTSLLPGDVLYFDEAFDRDERHLLNHQVLPNLKCEAIGWTPTALALRVS